MTQITWSNISTCKSQHNIECDSFLIRNPAQKRQQQHKDLNLNSTKIHCRTKCRIRIENRKKKREPCAWRHKFSGCVDLMVRLRYRLCKIHQIRAVFFSVLIATQSNQFLLHKTHSSWMTKATQWNYVIFIWAIPKRTEQKMRSFRFHVVIISRSYTHTKTETENRWNKMMWKNGAAKLNEVIINRMQTTSSCTERSANHPNESNWIEFVFGRVPLRPRVCVCVRTSNDANEFVDVDRLNNLFLLCLRIRPSQCGHFHHFFFVFLLLPLIVCQCDNSLLHASVCLFYVPNWRQFKTIRSNEHEKKRN